MTKIFIEEVETVAMGKHTLEHRFQQIISTFTGNFEKC